MHVLSDGGHILMLQQFLQGENVAAEHQKKAHRECMTEDVRANSFIMRQIASCQCA
ncbi:hypothetical protein KSZ_14890 [Dictyobacter formicarum]|uniref:Uncharacterized protein n=1 Tax=Dictyobacter formicarum TaxID=2778368 RepID=A0ABQ3VCV1_9CHLR|nr:hypothetical protein KSZ_14890 [Dictyobacter formicarum]